MKRLLIAATASLVVGSALVADDTKRTTDTKTTDTRTIGSKSTDSSKHRFVAGETLVGAKVKARTGDDEEGKIENLVVDTRNGVIAYAILDSNGILDVPNKTVAIPYGALSWDASAERFVVDVTAEELRNLPKWDSSDLSRLRDPGWHGTLKGVFGDRPELENLQSGYAYYGDEYTCHFKQGKPEKIEGKIVSIDRDVTTPQGGSVVAIEVEDQKHGKQTIYLAPAAHMTSKQISPAEGTMVTVSTIDAIDSNGKRVRVAEWVRIDGNTVNLREKGVPAWQSETQQPMRAFYVLASELDDGKLYSSNGEAFGNVTDVGFDVTSGTAAFAIVSVGGVLGVNDTVYAVPWSAVSIGKDENLYVAMDNEKLKLAPKLSQDGIDDLNNADYFKQVLAYYDEEPMRFDTERSSKWTNHRQASIE
jgi:sporulation protein YlmC with PRC-barrel domain